MLDIEQGSVLHNPVFGDDIFPTIIEIARAKIPADHIYDGLSILPLINGEGKENERALFWHYPHKWGPVGPGLDPFTSIVYNDWKLIYFYHDQTWELYHIADDITESRNLIRRNQVVASDLYGKMTEWMRRVDAQLPVSKETGLPVSFPEWNFRE